MNYTRKFHIIHVYNSINQNKQTNPTINIFGQRHDFLDGFSYYEIPFLKIPINIMIEFFFLGDNLWKY